MSPNLIKAMVVIVLIMIAYTAIFGGTPVTTLFGLFLGILGGLWAKGRDR